MPNALLSAYEVPELKRCELGQHEHDSPPGVSNGFLLDLLDTSWSGPKRDCLETGLVGKAEAEAGNSGGCVFGVGGVH
jgi:hypothetical protein